MLKIEKSPEPGFFKSYLIHHKPKIWNDIPLEIRIKLREYIKENEQKWNTNCLCVYCERKIDEYSHLEHIKPRAPFPELTFTYENIVVSCKDNNTCGKHKYSNWKDKFIDPVSEDPEPFFIYISNGEMIPSSKNKIRSEYTINTLNLNHDKLKSLRKIIIKQMQSYPQEFKDKMEQFFDMFPSLIKYYKNYPNLFLTS